MLTLAVATAPGKGTLSLLDQSARTVRYTAGASGADTFTIVATDPTGASATLPVSVTVSPTRLSAPRRSPHDDHHRPVRPVAITKIATLPSTKTCFSRRVFRIRLRNVKGGKVVRAQIKLNGKQKRSVKGKALSLPIDLRGLPKGRFTVEIVTTDSKGARLVGKRRYTTCAKKRASG